MCNFIKIQKSFIAAFIVIIFFSCGGNENSNKPVENIVDNIIDNIKRENIVETLRIADFTSEMITGENEDSTKQQKNYQELKQVATVDQLITLTDDTNAVVRCYAFQALATKSPAYSFKIVLKHLNDTSLVRDRMGMTLFAGDYFVGLVTGNFIDNKTHKLRPKEKEMLDSVFLNNNTIILSAKSSIFSTLKPIPANYPKIRELVKNERNKYALQTLAKYQNQMDKALIVSFLKLDSTQSYALYAISEFPDYYFYPFIKKIFQKGWEKGSGSSLTMKACYQVLARYPIPETLKFFENTVKLQDEFSSRRTYIYFLFLAAKKYPNELYDPIVEKLKLSDDELYTLRRVEELATENGN